MSHALPISFSVSWPCLCCERPCFTPKYNNRQNHASVYFNLYKFRSQTGWQRFWTVWWQEFLINLLIISPHVLCVYRVNKKYPVQPTELECTPQYKKTISYDCRPSEAWLPSQSLPEIKEVVQSFHLEFPCRNCRRQTEGNILSSTASDWGSLPGFPKRCPCVHPHFVLSVWEFLNMFPKQRIGWGGPTAWPDCPLGLNPLNFYLWGNLKSTVCLTEVSDMQDL